MYRIVTLSTVARNYLMFGYFYTCVVSSYTVVIIHNKIDIVYYLDTRQLL